MNKKINSCINLFSCLILIESASLSGLKNQVKETQSQNKGYFILTQYFG